MRESLRYILTLSLICMVMASLLSGVYFLTRSKILEQKTHEERQALKEVCPKAGYFEPIVENNKIIYFRAYRSSDKEDLLGYAFRTEAQGYSSVIEAMAGMDREGGITGVRILAQNETPGLGARISEVLVRESLWEAIKAVFSREKKYPKSADEPWFCARFKGKKISEDIQAITGATISSQGLIDSVCKKAKEVLGYEQ